MLFLYVSFFSTFFVFFCFFSIFLFLPHFLNELPCAWWCECPACAPCECECEEWCEPFPCVRGEVVRGDTAPLIFGDTWPKLRFVGGVDDTGGANCAVLAVCHKP